MNSQMPVPLRTAASEAQQEFVTLIRTKSRRLLGLLIGSFLLGAAVLSAVIWSLRPPSDHLDNLRSMSRSERQILERLQAIGLDRFDLSVPELEARLGLSNEAMALTMKLDRPFGDTQWGHYLPEWTGLKEEALIGKDGAIQIFVRHIANLPESKIGPVLVLINDAVNAVGRAPTLLAWLLSLTPEQRADLDKTTIEYLGTREGRDLLQAMAALQKPGLELVRAASSSNSWMLRSLLMTAPEHLENFYQIELAYQGTYSNHGPAPFPCLSRVRVIQATDGKSLSICEVILH
jgi:hypothetical protein